ncbi:MAG TPA: enoyl-CoA hydratase/isomerase [Rhizomicrobium sp.]
MTQSSFDRVTLAGHGKVAVITLDHPPTINALSSTLAGGLEAALEAVLGGGFRALVLTGAGRGFCSGADMKELPGRREEGAGRVLERLYHPLFRTLRDLPMPVVTAINGPAVGIGMSLALMGDLILAARSAYFLLSFARIGLVPDGGLTWLLPRAIGVTRARELALLAEPLPAEKALEWGLINRVYDDGALMGEAMKLAHELANGPTVALSLIRQLYWESPDNSFEEQLNLEFKSQRVAGGAEDFREGVTAFLEKRTAKFKGK